MKIKRAARHDVGRLQSLPQLMIHHRLYLSAIVIRVCVCVYRVLIEQVIQLKKEL